MIIKKKKKIESIVGSKNKIACSTINSRRYHCLLNKTGTIIIFGNIPIEDNFSSSLVLLKTKNIEDHFFCCNGIATNVGFLEKKKMHFLELFYQS